MKSHRLFVTTNKVNTMSKTHEPNQLAITTANRLLAVLGSFTLDMLSYKRITVSDPLVTPDFCKETDQHCGTTFCLAGYLASMDGYPEEYREGSRFNYSQYACHLIGVPLPQDPLWSFMFGIIWNNDVDLARKRCEYVRDHGCCPSDFSEWFKYGLNEKGRQWLNQPSRLSINLI